MEEEYDEDVELRLYVINHFEHLMTDVERAAICTVRFNIQHEDGTLIKDYADFKGNTELERAVRDIWELGFPEAYNVISRRIARDHPDVVFANRCPKCKRLPRTPRAKQCQWCKYNWRQQPPY